MPTNHLILRHDQRLKLVMSDINPAAHTPELQLSTTFIRALQTVFDGVFC